MPQKSAGWGGGGAAKLLRADGLDFFALDADLYAQRGTDVGALDDGAANPDIAGKIGGAEGIIEGVTARIADQRVRSVTEIVIGAESVEIGDVFEFAVAVRRFAREGPVAGRGSGGASREPHDCGRDVFASEFIADEEIDRGPRLGHVGDLSNGGVLLVGVGQEGIGVRSRGWYFNLRGGFRASGALEGLGPGQEADGEE